MVGPRCFDVGIALQVQLVRITNPQTCKLSRATACKSNVALPPRCTVRSVKPGGYAAFERGLPMTMVSFGQAAWLAGLGTTTLAHTKYLKTKNPEGPRIRSEGPRPASAIAPPLKRNCLAKPLT
jgi:hypothetical protein